MTVAEEVSMAILWGKRGEEIENTGPMDGITQVGLIQYL
jgi:hypothetical protein